MKVKDYMPKINILLVGKIKIQLREENYSSHNIFSKHIDVLYLPEQITLQCRKISD